MVVKSFEFAPGFRAKVNANVAGAVCEGLREQGQLTAAKLVEVSKPKNAPLHNAFEWNNGEAARLWREQQARTIIGNLRVVVEDVGEPIKAYFNLRIEEPEYKSLEVILQDRDDTEILLRNALRDLNSFRRKYSQLKQLAGVFDALDQLTIDVA